MSKIIPTDIIKSMRGKVCTHSDYFFQERNGSIFTGRRCNVRDLKKHPYSKEEIARQTLFRNAIEAVNQLSAEDTAAYKKRFAAQRKYRTLRGFMVAQEYAKLTD